MSNREAPSLTRSRNALALPDSARPTRQVNPIIAPFRFLIALIRCKVLLMPALLSTAKSPTCNMRNHQISINQLLLVLPSALEPGELLSTTTFITFP